ncbi:MAG TPA: hypothetical protein VIU44_08090 [Gaiellaceae bacterium]
MNLHGLARGLVAAVNPEAAATLRISAGAYSTAADGTRTPLYQTPAAFQGSISGNTLTVDSVGAGVVAPGQTIAGASVLPGTMITGRGTGSGGAGTYQVSRAQTVADEAMTAALTVRAQVQDLSQRDLLQLNGLNVQGSQKTVYVGGMLSGVVRPTQKGGDLITLDDGTWLTTAVLEQWPDWCRVAVTLQMDGA